MLDKAIVMIGGGKLQMPALRWAREAGLKVLLIDKNITSNNNFNADEFFNASGDNSNQLENFISRVKEKYNILGCYCGSDFGLISVAKLNKKLGIEGPDIQSVHDCLNKEEAKKKMKQAGLPVVEGITLEEIPSNLSNEFSFPLIVKPLDSSGSRGVSVAMDDKQLKIAFSNAKKFNTKVLVENYLEGNHIDISGIILNKKFFPGGILDRFFSPLPYRVPIYGIQPSSITQKLQKDLYSLLEKAAKSLGILSGPVKADIILTDRGPFIIEITPRLHGEVSSSFVCNLTYGTSPVKQWINWISSKKLPDEQAFHKEYCYSGWAGLFCNKPGTLKNIKGIQKAKEICGIEDVLIRRDVGAHFNSTTDNTALIGFLFAVAKSAKEVKKIFQEAMKTIEIEME